MSLAKNDKEETDEPKPIIDKKTAQKLERQYFNTFHKIYEFLDKDDASESTKKSVKETKKLSSKSDSSSSKSDSSSSKSDSSSSKSDSSSSKSDSSSSKSDSSSSKSDSSSSKSDSSSSKSKSSSSKSKTSSSSQKESKKYLKDKANSDTAAKGAASGSKTAEKVVKVMEIAGSVISTVGTITGAFAKSFKDKEKKEAQELASLREQNLQERNYLQDEAIVEQFEKVSELGNTVNLYIESFGRELEKNSELISDLADEFEQIQQDTIEKFNQMKIFIKEMKELFENWLSELTKETVKSFEVLGETINKRFRALRQLDVQIQFTEEVLLDTDLLDSLMTQAMKFPSNETKDDFIQQYKIKGPLRIIAGLANRLKYKYTNPIVVAMELHAFKSKEILEFWKSNINSIIYKLLIVEGFYYGLEEIGKNTSETYLIPFFEAVDYLRDTMKSSNEHFKMDSESYWPELVGFNVDRIMEMAETRDSAAEAIQKLLNGIHTTDVFSVHFFEGDFIETKNSRFTRSYINSERFKPIEGDTVLTVSSYNHASTSSNVSQIASFDTEFKLAVCIMRSETHHMRSDDDNMLLNNEFFEKVNSKVKDYGSRYLLNHENFRLFFQELNAEIGGKLGGAVMSSLPIVEFLTNGELSPLEWYNQVPSQSLFVNLMWA